MLQSMSNEESGGEQRRTEESRGSRGSGGDRGKQRKANQVGKAGIRDELRQGRHAN